MTPESEAPPQAEPTMEEILASIRKIIASDKPEETTPGVASEEILELTDVVAEEAAVAPVVESAPAVVPSAVALPEPVKEIAMPPSLEPVAAPVSGDALLSETASQASASVFANLAQHLQQERQPIPANIALGDGQQTLEGLITGIMRPMLKEWLDQNLPATVERMVHREIERITRAHRD
ncbi:MAG: DUF2497 domain-containing protein [Alphaproteobacteria bacterium]